MIDSTNSSTATGNANAGSSSSSSTTGSSSTGSTGGITAKAGDTYKAARDKTMSAYDTARGRAADVTRQASSQVSVYPVAAVVGGLAVGALVGFLLPSTRREQEVLASTGKKITDAAREATTRGIEAGKEQIDEIRTKATQKVGEAVVEAVASATGTSGGSTSTGGSSTSGTSGSFGSGS